MLIFQINSRLCEVLFFVVKTRSRRYSFGFILSILVFLNLFIMFCTFHRVCMLANKLDKFDIDRL